ncbi:MAG: hypothetical protein QXY05_01060 [Candidatus Anstonellales archaeon]
MFKDTKKPTGKPGIKPGPNGGVEFGKFKEVAEKKVDSIKEQIKKMVGEGKGAEEIAAWFCKEVDNDKLGKGNAYFDALIELLKPYVLVQSDEGAVYIEIISEVHAHFMKKMENKERGQMHWENMQKRFEEKGLPLEIEE